MNVSCCSKLFRLRTIIELRLLLCFAVVIAVICIAFIDKP